LSTASITRPIKSLELAKIMSQSTMAPTKELRRDGHWAQPVESCTHRASSWATIAFIAFVGCKGSTGSITVPATGKLTYQGQPVADAVVVFNPPAADSATLGGTATTDEQGAFQISTNSSSGQMQRGIAPGKYVVTVSKLSLADTKTMSAPPRNLLPKKYFSAKTSDLSAEVKTGADNRFDFVLKPE
jgi:hypothetical protein